MRGCTITVAHETRRRLAPEDRKRQLLDYALNVFALRGLGRAGHTEIAQLAGVSVATVFNYFNTRETLVNEVLCEVEDVLGSLAVKAAGGSNDPETMLEYYIDAFLSACEERPDHIKIWLEWSSSIREDTWPRYLEFQQHFLELLASQIERGIQSGQLATGLSAEERARWVLGNAHMLVSMAFNPGDSDPADLRDMVRRGFRHIIGIQTP